MLTRWLFWQPVALNSSNAVLVLHVCDLKPKLHAHLCQVGATASLTQVSGVEASYKIKGSRRQGQHHRSSMQDTNGNGITTKATASIWRRITSRAASRAAPQKPTRFWLLTQVNSRAPTKTDTHKNRHKHQHTHNPPYTSSSLSTPQAHPPAKTRAPHACPRRPGTVLHLAAAPTSPAPPNTHLPRSTRTAAQHSAVFSSPATL